MGLTIRRNIRWATILFSCFCCSRLLCTTCLNVLDSPGISLLLCLCYPFHIEHGLFKDPPSLVAICTPEPADQGYMHAKWVDDCRRISWACIGQELLPFQLSTVYVCTTWRLNLKAWALLPGFCIAVPLLHVGRHGCLNSLPDCCHEPETCAYLCA